MSFNPDPQPLFQWERGSFGDGSVEFGLPTEAPAQAGGFGLLLARHAGLLFAGHAFFA